MNVRMNSIVRIGAVVAAVVLLSGCIEIFQYVGYDDAGNLELTMTVKVQKAVFDMANEFSESGEEFNYRQEFGFSEGELEEDFPEWAPLDYSIEEIDTEREYGVTVSFSGQEEAILGSEDSMEFLPRRRGNETIIDFSGAGGETDAGGSPAGGDEFAAAFLAGAKYRLLISRTYIADIRKVVFEVDGESQPVDVSEFRDVYLLELPLSSIFMSESAGRIRIRH